MLRHIVLYRFHNESDIIEAERMLKSMQGRVEEIIELEVGRDVVHSGRSYELALVVTLASKEKLESYQANEYHAQTVKAFMHKVVKEAASVDYII